MLRNKYSRALDLWRDLSKRYNLDINLPTAEFILAKLVKENDVHNIEKIEEYLSPVSIKRQLKNVSRLY